MTIGVGRGFTFSEIVLFYRFGVLGAEPSTRKLFLAKSVEVFFELLERYRDCASKENIREFNFTLETRRRPVNLFWHTFDHSRRRIRGDGFPVSVIRPSPNCPTTNSYRILRICRRQLPRHGRTASHLVPCEAQVEAAISIRSPFDGDGIGRMTVYFERTGAKASRNSLGLGMVTVPPLTRITPRCFQSLRMRLTLSRDAPMLRAMSS